MRKGHTYTMRFSKRAVNQSEGGFTLLELIIVMAGIGVLALVGLSAYAAFRGHALKAEADAAWEELSMAVNLYRIDTGSWPERYTHAVNLNHVTGLWGALAVNLAPSDYEDQDRAAAERMVGFPGTGGPTSLHQTGHLVLHSGELCVWVDGVPSSLNDASCPRSDASSS